MATPAQVAANRANAQKSTGPSSAEGKAASRFNALKHGLDAASVVLPGEDPHEYAALAADYYASSAPQSPEERFHVETMIRSDWQKRRLQRVEADLYRTLLAESPGSTLAQVLLGESPVAKLLLRVQRQLAAFERSWFRAHSDLHRARRQAAVADEAALDLYLNAPTPGLTFKPPRELASFSQPHTTVPPTPAANPALRL